MDFVEPLDRYEPEERYARARLREIIREKGHSLLRGEAALLVARVEVDAHRGGAEVSPRLSVGHAWK